MSKPVSIIVAGCAGRMGRAILKAVRDAEGVKLAGGFDRPDCAQRGQDLMRLVGVEDSGLAILAPDEINMAKADVLVDFTSPESAIENARRCADAGVAMVIGATGFSSGQDEAVAACAKEIAVVKSGNMSLGVNALCALAERAAALLGEAYDIEITDAHHRHKVDAPSGTALMLGAAAARGRGVDFEKNAVCDRTSRDTPRGRDEIGFSVTRGGGIIGEHSVRLIAEDEEVVLSHKALDRALFARGAVAAARWVAGRAPGLYSMRDVLGI
ncbi:MAG: 4-hydroxy-tetrahydrodipicolinate reductase [Parvularculaceae bacterium]